MPTFSMTHEIDCDVDRFWELFFDEAFTKRMFADLEFKAYDFVSRKDTDTEIQMTIKAVPKMDMPGPIAKVLGDGFGYTEEGTFDRVKKVYRFVTKPNTLEGKLKSGGSIHCEPLGPNRCKRIVESYIEAKIFGIGGAIEKMTEKSYRDGFGKGADLMNRYIKEMK